MPAVPRFASTVILYRLKEGTDDSNKCDFEIFLIQRSRELKFLGGFHAFPGGKLEDEDILEKTIARCEGLDKNQAHQIILDKQTSHTDKNFSIGFWITGIREVFEETGILFAYDRDFELIRLNDPTHKEKFEVYRNKLLKNEILFSDLIETEDLFYALDKLHYFRHFITPDLSPIRYDTRFFLAEIPPHQTLGSTSSEIISSEWIDPTSAIKRYRKNIIKLIPPQYACISKLRKVADIRDFCTHL